MDLNNKKTKIIATLGPATSSKEVLYQLAKEGVNVFRINFSHADYTDVKERIDIIRSLNNEFGYTKQVIRLAKHVTKVRRKIYY